MVKISIIIDTVSFKVILDTNNKTHIQKKNRPYNFISNKYNLI